MSSSEFNCLEFNYNCPHLAFLINDLHTALRTKRKHSPEVITSQESLAHFLSFSIALGWDSYLYLCASVYSGCTTIQGKEITFWACIKKIISLLSLPHEVVSPFKIISPSLHFQRNLGRRKSPATTGRCSTMLRLFRTIRMKRRWRWAPTFRSPAKIKWKWHGSSQNTLHPKLTTTGIPRTTTFLMDLGWLCRMWITQWWASTTVSRSMSIIRASRRLWSRSKRMRFIST